MRAIVQDKFGSPEDVLKLKEIGKPMVEDDGVLVRVHATSIPIGDAHMTQGGSP
jgi:NADPH:quinone reductase-like Zn-dependent oxidoreductase